MTAIDDHALLASDQPFAQRMCPHLREAQQGSGVRRVRTPAGDEAWLVSGHAEIRNLLQDRRLGRSHPAPDGRARYAGQAVYDEVTSTDHNTADARHATLRAFLKPVFGAKRIQALQPRLKEIIELQLDRLTAKGPPADLHKDLSVPLVELAFGELVGIPAADRGRFVALLSGDEAGLTGFLLGLVAGKREHPDDSMVSLLCEKGANDEQVVQIVSLLRFAGMSATHKQIDYGFLMLSREPAVRARLARDPDLLAPAVEEMLRLSGSLSLPRYARENIEIGGVTITKGDLVMVDYTLGNYHEDAFADPVMFDVTRSPNRHLSFSHGEWTCLGAPFARLLLQMLFAEMLTRLPTLRPANPPATHSGPLSGGLNDELPVTW